MRAAARRGARIILTSLLLVSLVFAAWNAFALWRSPLGGMLVARGEAEVSARLERLLAREVTPEKLDRRLTELLAAEPRNWASIDALMALADAQGVTPSPPVVAAVEAADDADRNWLETSKDCAACAWDPARCDLSAIAICQVVVAVTPFGDVASIARESAHYARGEPVDEIDLLLSAIGLGAVAIVPLTGGASASVKAGAGFAKTAYRLGALSEPILDAGRGVARAGVDWARLADIRPGSAYGDIAAAIRPGALRPAIGFLEDAAGIVKATGTTDALLLISKVDDLGEARRMAVAARALGPKTAGAIEARGKSRILRLTMRLSNEVYAILSSAISAMLAIAGLGASALKRVLLGRLRRLAR